MTAMPGSLDELSALTPDTRDRYVDFLRAVSILAVVVGHWMVSMIWWRGGILYLTNAIPVTPGLWIATWVFQVMPVFFFVGGFANLVAYESFRRRGDSTWAFVRSRASRLLRPAAPFLGIWLVVQVAMHLADVGTPTGMVLWGHTRLLRGMDPPASTLPFGPLWFLVVYLVVVSISPWTIRLHLRYRWWVIAAMAGGAVAADAIGFVGGVRWVRYINIAFVLLLPHQLGHFYGDGTLQRVSRRAFSVMAGAGLALLLVLTNPPLFELAGTARFRWFPGIGYYPKSLVGTGTERISNAYPPTLCYLAVGIMLIGLAMAVREPMTGWLQRPRPWKVVIAVNSVIMTVFLWFMTAYLLAILALWPLGFGREHSGGARWWLERPLWILAPGLVLAAIVATMGRFEQRRSARPAVPRT